jgi:tetratricopeptide (TPR) repeat protein
MERDNFGGKTPPFSYPKEEDAQLNEEEKIERDKIAKSIMTSFDKISQRYLERYINAFNRAAPERKVQLNEFAKQIGLLLSKRACIPGFYLYVLKKTMVSKKLQRQRATLTKAFLISMLKQEGFKLEDIIEKRLSLSTNNSKLYTRRHVQRIIHDYVPDAFFEVENAPMKRGADERVKSITSIFSSREMPRTRTTVEASQFAKSDNQLWQSSSVAMDMIRHNAEISPIMPDYIEDLTSFRQECKDIISRQNFLLREKYSKYLVAKNGNFTLLFEVFYRQVSSIIAQEWFLNQRFATRKRLIVKGYPFRYKSADAIKARKLLLALLRPERQVDFLMSLCAISLQEQGLFEQSVALNKEILRSANLTPLERGVVLENTGVVYRNSGRYKLMIRDMKKALAEYETAGDLYRVCVALKNVGEAEWYMSFQQKAWSFFRKAEEGIPKLVNSTEHFGVFWNLASAFKRIGDAKSETKYLTKCLENLPDSETDKILTIEKRLHELDRFL